MLSLLEHIILKSFSQFIKKSRKTSVILILLLEILLKFLYLLKVRLLEVLAKDYPSLIRYTTTIRYVSYLIRFYRG